MFFRIFHPPFKETLYNVAHISKIEVVYADGSGYRTTIETAANDENATRAYKVFIGSEELLIDGSEDNPVAKLMGEIYKAAIKG